MRWGGVDLAALFGELGIQPCARFVWSYGLDRSTFAGVPCDGYVKDLPVGRLNGGDVLIAYELNGAPLRDEHGFPARLVMPGYYGTNSVKWLSRLTLAPERATGPFTTQWYNDVLPDAAGRPMDGISPVWAIEPESVIVSSAPEQALPDGKSINVWGWAWSDGGVAALDVSSDGGTGWMHAGLEPPSGRTWQRLSLTWRPERHGRYEICACAHTHDGRSQPSCVWAQRHTSRSINVT